MKFEETLKDLRVIGRTLRFVILTVVPVAVLSLTVYYTYLPFFIISFLGTLTTVAARLLRYDTLGNFFSSFASASVNAFTDEEEIYEPDFSTTKSRVKDIEITIRYGLAAPFVGMAVLAFVTAGYTYNYLDLALTYITDNVTWFFGIDYSLIPDDAIMQKPKDEDGWTVDDLTVASPRTNATNMSLQTFNTLDSDSSFAPVPRVIRGAREQPASLAWRGSNLQVVPEDAAMPESNNNQPNKASRKADRRP